MPPSDQEPRYQLVDSNGNVVGSLFGDGSGNVVIADETDTQTTFDANGITTPALEAEDVNTETIGQDYYFAKSADGSNPDDRLSNLISNVPPESTIYLESGVYTEPITISQESMTIIGVGAGTNYQDTMTVTGDGSIVQKIFFNRFERSGELILDGGDQIADTLPFATVLLTTNSDDCSVDSVTNALITDNGTNNNIGDQT